MHDDSADDGGDRVEVVVERATLDGQGMVCDLDVLEAALQEAVTALEGKDLDSIRPPEATVTATAPSGLRASVRDSRKAPWIASALRCASWSCCSKRSTYWWGSVMVPYIGRSRNADIVA